MIIKDKKQLFQMIRHIFQEHIDLNNPKCRSSLKAFTLDDEEMEALHQFQCLVADHYLEDTLVATEMGDLTNLTLRTAVHNVNLVTEHSIRIERTLVNVLKYIDLFFGEKRANEMEAVVEAKKFLWLVCLGYNAEDGWTNAVKAWDYERADWLEKIRKSRNL